MGEHEHDDRPATSYWFDPHDDARTNPIAYLPADPAAEPVEPEQTDRGEDDHLVQYTFNGLRPDDLNLDQPSQSPSWEPS